MAPTTKSAATLRALGLAESDEQLYRTLLRAPGQSVADLADQLGLPERGVRRRLDRLVHMHLIRVVDGVPTAEPPETALGRLVQSEGDRLRERQDELERAQMAIPQLLSEHRAALSEMPGPIPMELAVDVDVPRLLASLVMSTSGEILSLRPDQWSLPVSQLVDDLLVERLKAGRAARVIYPAAMLENPPEAILVRMRAGERVRLLPTVPSRLIVFGDEAAVLTARWGDPGGSRVVVRHEGVIGALRELFDALWQQATSAPMVSDGVDDAQRQLLQMMAMGAIDEQIARMMGISLRTVRRRISEILAELGVTSRFQAGAEAVRRGWL